MRILIKNWFQNVSKLPKRKLFLLILIFGGVSATIAALLVDLFFLDMTGLPPLRIALVAPMTGEESALGRAMREGVEFKIAEVNRAGGIKGRKLAIIPIDDANRPDRARIAAAEAVSSGAIAVIGHTNNDTLSAAAPVYAQHKMGVITLAADQIQSPSERPQESHFLVAEDYEIRFLANYIRNVVGEKTVHILYEDSPRGEMLANIFDETMQRFGTKVLYRWALTSESSNLNTQVAAAAQQLNAGKLPGTILIIANAATSAHAVIGLRANGIRNPIAGTRTFATDSFTETLKNNWNGTSSVEAALNGTLLTVPMLFDVAGEVAQNFRTEFIARFRHAPDWIAAYAHDTVQVIVENLHTDIVSSATTDEVLRTQLFHQLSEAWPEVKSSSSNSSTQTPQLTFDGVNGQIILNARGRKIRPPFVGTYDGVDLISTMTQLVPIREEGIGNLLQQFVEGRALYVNDRFMYKTNVVYTGVQPANIYSFDAKESMLEGEFLIWFRWRGDFEPEDIVFTNAVTPIQLKKPDHEEKTKDINYRVYRVQGKFFMNFSNVARAFDTKLIGLTFHHRLLSRHNLMYVNDILGMGMTRDMTLTGILNESSAIAPRREHDTGIMGILIKRLRLISQVLHSDNNVHDPLVGMLSQTNVLAGVPGWVIEKAWISQDIEPRNSNGDPNYVGFGRPVPDFSQVELGIVLKPDLVRARDIIPSQYFWYIAIFSGFGAFLAFLLDRKYGKQFWRAQTFVLRLVFWPLLLISLGNLVLDDASRYATLGVVSNLWTIYSIANWLVPMFLIIIAVERFMWIPLEQKTQRKIPNIVRLLINAVIFLLTLFFIVAYVFNQTVTSLLATTGLSAMIIGLAIKSNIANVFSGIILNIEKPFSIGDKIEFALTTRERLKGKVVDITWRTTLIEHELGHIVSVPNGKISELGIHNLSLGGKSGFLCDLLVYVDPHVNQEKILPILKAAISGNPHIMERPGTAPFGVVLLGMRNVGETWRALYRVRIYVKGSPEGKPVCTKAGDIFWKQLLKNFQESGIVWNQPPLLITDKSCESVA